MKLHAFFDAVGPYFRGEAPLQDAVAKLGSVVPSRLELYGKFCDLQRRESLEAVYSLTHRCVAREIWYALSGDYFRAHPCKSWDLNANVEAFPAFLAQRGGFPRWLGELADLEWWQFQSFVAIDPGKSKRTTRLELHESVALRPYAHDVVSLVLADEPPASDDAVKPSPTVALLWRDASLEEHVMACSPVELAVLKAVVERIALPKAAQMSAMPLKILEKTEARLIARGVLVPPQRPNVRKPARTRKRSVRRSRQ